MSVGITVSGTGRLTAAYTPAPGAGTAFGWVYVTDDTPINVDFWWSTGNATGNRMHCEIGTTSNLRFLLDRATTDLQIIVPAADFAVWGMNKWLWWAVGWDSTGVDTDQWMMIGDLTTPGAEPSSYSTQVVGAGTNAVLASGLMLGNQSTGNNRGFPGWLATFGYTTYRMTPATARTHQWGPSWPSDAQVAYSLITQAFTTDLSGNARTLTVAGTVTDEEHVPIPQDSGLRVQSQAVRRAANW